MDWHGIWRQSALAVSPSSRVAVLSCRRSAGSRLAGSPSRPPPDGESASLANCRGSRHAAADGGGRPPPAYKQSGRRGAWSGAERRQRAPLWPSSACLVTFPILARPGCHVYRSVSSGGAGAVHGAEQTARSPSVWMSSSHPHPWPHLPPATSVLANHCDSP